MYIIGCPVFMWATLTNYCKETEEVLNPECTGNLNVLAAFSGLALYMKLFYYMRIYRAFTTFIRMISEMVKEVSTFAIMLFIVLAAFANVLLVLSFNRDPANAEEELFADFVGMSAINALLHAWLTGLGEFGFDNFSAQDAATTWFIFFLATVLI
jgi:hypothetical protein